MTTSRKRSHKKLIAIISSLLLLCIGMTSCMPKSDSYIRSRIVRLHSDHGMCTGEQVRAPSGRDYVITAGHCDILIKDGKIHADLEDGRKMNLRVLEESDEYDLMLLEGVPSMQGLDLASVSHARDYVKTLTHGRDFPTYRTEGVLVGERRIQVLLNPLLTEEDEAKCRGPKNEIVDIVFAKVCILNEDTTATTAFIVPGSSGGGAYNSDGDLVGVASAIGEGFGFLVRLQDIRSFLHNY